MKCNTWNALLFCFICTSGSVRFFCTFFKMKCNIGMKRGKRSKMMCKIRAHFPPIWEVVLKMSVMVFYFSQFTTKNLVKILYDHFSKCLNFSFQICHIHSRFNPMSRVPRQLPSSLQGLDLVGMGIMSLKSGDFEDLPNLQTLSLWRNSIKSIEDQTFQNLNKVYILELFENQIEKLTNKTFLGLAGVQKLDITENQIKSVDSGKRFKYSCNSCVLLISKI